MSNACVNIKWRGHARDVLVPKLENNTNVYHRENGDWIKLVKSTVGLS
jgi:stringent starvation protein B